MSRKMCFDTFRLDDKVIREDDDELVMRGVIASEIVQKYDDGWAYKSADELEKAYETLQLLISRPVKSMDHPATGLLVQRSDVNGRMENFTFHKDLMDPKTQRPMRRGIKADIVWFKRYMAPDVLDKIKNGELLDVSIGFTYEPDATPGAWNGIKYDYLQREIFVDHLAAPVPHGRCTAPYCGIGVDQVLKIAGDPWEETEENIRSGHRDPGDFHEGSMRTITISEEEGIQAVIGCPKTEEYSGGRCQGGTEVQSYLFSKEKGWTMSKAKAWFSEHEGDTLQALIGGDPFAGYPNMEACIEEKSRDPDIEDPAAYCAELQRQAEGDVCPVCDILELIGKSFNIDITDGHERMAKGIGALMLRYLGPDRMGQVLKRAHDILGSLELSGDSIANSEHEGGPQDKKYDAEKILRLYAELHH